MIDFFSSFAFSFDDRYTNNLYNTQEAWSTNAKCSLFDKWKKICYIQRLTMKKGLWKEAFVLLYVADDVPHLRKKHKSPSCQLSTIHIYENILLFSQGLTNKYIIEKISICRAAVVVVFFRNIFLTSYFQFEKASALRSASKRTLGNKFSRFLNELYLRFVAERDFILVQVLMLNFHSFDIFFILFFVPFPGIGLEMENKKRLIGYVQSQ